MKPGDNILSYVASDEKELTAWARLLEIRTENLLSVRAVWGAVERLAGALLEKRTIRRTEAAEIIREVFR